MPDKLTPRGAHGQPHRDFFRACRATDQQQRGQVAARDGEDEADDDEHSDAIAMNGVSAWGWIRTSVEGTTVMPGPTANSPSVRNCIRILGREPLREHVHRRFGLRQVTPSRRRAFTRKGATIVAASRGARFAKIAGTAVIGSQKSVPRPMSTVPR